MKGIIKNVSRNTYLVASELKKKINSCNILVGKFREIILFAWLYRDFNKKQEKNHCSSNLIFLKCFPSSWASKVSKLIPRQRVTDDSAAAIQWSYKEQISEAYLERSQTSTLKLFWEISWRILAVKYFRKKSLSQILDWFQIRLWISSKLWESLLVCKSANQKPTTLIKKNRSSVFKLSSGYLLLHYYN